MTTEEVNICNWFDNYFCQQFYRAWVSALIG